VGEKRGGSIDLRKTAVRRWVAQADVDAGLRDGMTTAERE